MKVSVVTTVYNEEKTITALLESLLSQTRRPDEIVIVDGGSTDQTSFIIRDFKNTHKQIKIRFFIRKTSIAAGRNFAVRKARHKIIAQIDGGCVAQEEWLEKITEPFSDPEVGLVAGFYEMRGDSSFQEAIAAFHGIHPMRFDPRVFMPSGRSVSFRKEVWKQVGGYSEYLERAGEDTLFNYRVLKAGVRIARVKDAIVYWDLPNTFFESLKKFYRYAKGDAMASIWWHPAQGIATHNIKISLIFLRYMAWLSFLVLSTTTTIFLCFLIITFIFYSFWSIWKTRDVVYGLYAKLWVPLIQISSDITILLGFASGLVHLIVPQRGARHRGL